LAGIGFSLQVGFGSVSGHILDGHTLLTKEPEENYSQTTRRQDGRRVRQRHPIDVTDTSDRMQ